MTSTSQHCVQDHNLWTLKCNWFTFEFKWTCVSNLKKFPQCVLEISLSQNVALNWPLISDCPNLISPSNSLSVSLCQTQWKSPKVFLKYHVHEAWGYSGLWPLKWNQLIVGSEQTFVESWKKTPLRFLIRVILGEQNTGPLTNESKCWDRSEISKVKVNNTNIKSAHPWAKVGISA